MNVTINHPNSSFTGTITVLETVAVGFTNGTASVDIPPQAIAVFGSMPGFSYTYGAPGPAPAYDANLDTSVNAIVGNSSSATGGTLRAAFVAAIGLSNGTDDTATINALLTSARTAGGGLVKGSPGQTYLLTAPLVIGSYTTLDMTGCTVQTKSGNAGINLLRNYAYTAARTVMDAVTTAASTTVTSATAAFTSGDVGATVYLWGAGVQGDILRTTIASVTNSSTVVLADAATTALAAATMSVGPRDTGFQVIGGVWNRGTVSEGSTNSLHSLIFRRADAFTVRDLQIKTISGKYAIFPADCTGFTVERINFDTFADGVHLLGPVERAVIRDLSGYTHDDTVSLTPNDWTPFNDVWGDITDVYIDDIRPHMTDNTAVKVLGGSNSPLTTARRIRVRNVGGYANNIDQSQGGLVWIGNDPGMTQTAGGRIDDVTVENVAGRCKATEELVLINGSNIGKLILRNISAEPTASSAALGLVALIWCKSGASVDSLLIEGITTTSQQTVTSGMVTVSTGATIKSLTCRGFTMDAAASGTQLVTIAGTVTNLTICDVTGVGSASGTYLAVLQSNATVTNLILDRIAIAAGTGWKSPLFTGGTGITLSRMFMSNSSVESGQWVVGEFVTTTEVFLSNVRGSAGNVMWLQAAANVTMWAENCSFSSPALATTAGYALASKTIGYHVDISLVTTKAKGDLAYNTNAGLSCGVGPVVYTGTAWKSLVDGTTY